MGGEAIFAFVCVLGFVVCAGLLTVAVRSSHGRTKQLEQTKVRLLASDGLTGWAGRVGLEVLESSGGWRGRRVYGGVEIEVELDVESVEQLNGFKGPEGTRGRVRLRLGDRVPPGVVLKRVRSLVDPSTNYYGQSKVDARLRRFVNEGDAEALMLLLKTGVLEPLFALWAFEKTGTFELSGGGVTYEVFTALDFVMGEGDARGLELMGLCEAVVDAVPEAFDVQSARAAFMRDDTEEVRWRWRMARALFKSEQKGEVFEGLAGDLDALDPLSKAACACWGKYPLFELEPLVRHGALSAMAGKEHVGEDVASALSMQVGWLALFDTTLEPKTRLEAARRAPKAREAPRAASDKDASLVGLLTRGRPVVGFDRGEVLRVLGRGGWEPGKGVLKVLARDGDDAVRAQLLELIAKRGARAEDAEALGLLAEAKVGDAGKMLVALKSREGAGRLSLSAEDGMSGGLTQAGERGGLSAAEDG